MRPIIPMGIVMRHLHQEWKIGQRVPLRQLLMTSMFGDSPRRRRKAGLPIPVPAPQISPVLAVHTKLVLGACCPTLRNVAPALISDLYKRRIWCILMGKGQCRREPDGRIIVLVAVVSETFPLCVNVKIR